MSNPSEQRPEAFLKTKIASLFFRKPLVVERYKHRMVTYAQKEAWGGNMEVGQFDSLFIIKVIKKESGVQTGSGSCGVWQVGGLAAQAWCDGAQQ